MTGVSPMLRTCNPGRESEVREPAGWGPAEGYPPGLMIFRQGESPRYVYLIEQGMVKLVRVNEEGQALILGLRTPGWILGATSALLEKAYIVTAETVTACRLRRMWVGEFRDRIRTDGSLFWRVLQMQAHEVYQHLAQAAGLKHREARRRLEQVLWELAQVQGCTEGEVRVRCPLRYWELAQVVAVTPSYLSQLLGELEREGVVRRERGWIVIRDVRGLWREEVWSVCGFQQ